MTALLSALVLGDALRRSLRGAPLPRLHAVALAVLLLARALLQATSGFFPLGLAPTFLAPAGFALLALGAPRAGVVLVALARTRFVGWYLLGDNLALGLANVVGAAGAWAWATAPEPEGPEPEAVAA